MGKCLPINMQNHKNSTFFFTERFGVKQDLLHFKPVLLYRNLAVYKQFLSSFEPEIKSFHILFLRIFRTINIWNFSKEIIISGKKHNLNKNFGYSSFKIPEILHVKY